MHRYRLSLHRLLERPARPSGSRAPLFFLLGSRGGSGHEGFLFQVRQETGGKAGVSAALVVGFRHGHLPLFPARRLPPAAAGSGGHGRRLREVTTSLGKIGANKCWDAEGDPNPAALWCSGFKGAFVTVLEGRVSFPTAGLM